MKSVIIIAISVLIASVSITSIYAQSQYEIPSWVKGIAGYWAEGNISDSEFGEGLAFLIDSKIIDVPLIQELESKINQIQSENNRLKGQVSSLQSQNVDLQNKLNQQSTVPKTSNHATTKTQSDLNYPKVTKRTNGSSASDVLSKLADFHDSLTTSEKNKLVNYAVAQSQFTIIMIYAGNWNLTVTEGNFDFIQYEGSGISAIPFDCSTNMDYIYSIAGIKDDEKGEISLWLFKNGVLIDYDKSDKPYGTTSVASVCDKPSIINSIG